MTEKVEEHDTKPVRGEAARQLPIYAGVEQQPVSEHDHALALAMHLVAEHVPLIGEPAERHPLPCSTSFGTMAASASSSVTRPLSARPDT